MSTEPLLLESDAASEPRELAIDLTSLDDTALRGYLQTLISLVLKQVEEGFGLRRLRVRDECEAQAALWSACTSFMSHYHDGHLTDAKNAEDLAAHLLRIASNRAQRRRRRDNRMRDETRHGTGRDAEGGSAPLDHEDTSPGPPQRILQSELSAYLQGVIDSIKEGLRGRRHALRIIELYLEDMDRPQKEIASELGINQATVSRWIAWFHDKIRRMLEEDGMA